ncbi:serine hydrolase domain-containing protein [Cognatitamlana onchidii]|uniref:serine hydrolase domain-containing protein n=1 Tax=Cognatitamlana onchidii TaxID=2562860 RepID=UPI0010A5EC75|nr:serine hydrolase [Algibacter onchidii]
MKKNIFYLGLLCILLLNGCQTKTTKQTPTVKHNGVKAKLELLEANEQFIQNSEKGGIPHAKWDAPEYAAYSFTNAYKYTRHYRISHGVLGASEAVLTPEVLEVTNTLNLKQLKAYDADQELDLETLLRERLKNHSMVIIKDDNIVHQHFWNGMDNNATHLDMTVTKSFTSMCASIAVKEGKLDMSKQTTNYLPYLKETAFDGTTVQEVADMRTGLDIPTPEHLSWDPRFTLSQEWNGPNDSGLFGISEYLSLIKDRKYPIGEKYQYQDPNTEVLGMVVEIATGKNLADYFQDKMWTKLGVENDAFWMADPSGYVVASGGLNMTTRDLARVGKMLLNDGNNYIGENIIPKEFIDAIWEGNELVRNAWKDSKESHLAADAWYKDQFRILNIKGHKLLCMVGIHGQVVAVDKDKNVVITMNSGYTQTETPRMANLIFYQTLPTILNELD